MGTLPGGGHLHIQWGRVTLVTGSALILLMDTRHTSRGTKINGVDVNGTARE